MMTMDQPYFRISVQLQKFMKSLCRKAGASFMESIGVPISHIQEILGHENRKTTEGYIHSLGTNKVEAIERFEKSRSISGINK